MRSSAACLKRSILTLLVALLPAVLAMAGSVYAQQKAAPDPAKPKIRAVTAFINLDRQQFQQEIADALKMLRRAQTTFESRGYTVQTIRIATQPFPQYTQGMNTQQAVQFFKQLDALAEQQGRVQVVGLLITHSPADDLVVGQ